MASRYELSDVQWQRIEGFLPGRKEHVGRTAVDNRLFVNGVLWVLRSGARWSDLPERYGKYKSVHKRFMRWAGTGVWERIFRELVKDRKNLYLGPVIKYQAVALEVKIGPDEAERAGCNGPTSKRDNEVWADFHPQPGGTRRVFPISLSLVAPVGPLQFAPCS